MKRNPLHFLALSLAALPMVSMSTPASGDKLEGLWSYQSFTRPEYGEMPLVGLFLFHDGHFIHQAMHGGEPMKQQLTDAHIGTYQLESGQARFDVETGIVVTPAEGSLLSGRSNTSHQVRVERSGDKLFLSFANGATEKLVKVPTTKTELITLDRGMLALTDEHFVLVTTPDDGWLAGSGSYQRKRTALRLEAWRWFSVQGDKVDYAADRTFDASFDGKTLQLTDGPRFRVIE